MLCSNPFQPAKSFQLSSFIFLRGLGFLYFIAFLSLWNDLLPLLGSNGLLPVELYLDRIHEHFGTPWHAFLENPSLFHFHHADGFMQLCAGIGLLLSFALLIGINNVPLLFSLWALYFSFVSVGQRWYSFGWEYQLLETGFLAIFFVPLFHPTKRLIPSKISIYLGWWLGMRLMWGAGLIKIRGDSCWLDLTCLEYHFQTQPVPNFFSPYLHSLPAWALQLGVLFNHFVELLLPFALIGPRKAGNIAGVIFILFQGMLILSGNLSFLNWLSILPFILCIDDSIWSRLKPKSWNPVFQEEAHIQASSVLYGLVVCYLSIPIVTNLLSSKQSMNRSFDPLRLVNTYGAFGSVGKTRPELIIQGLDETGIWREYEFKCKPGSIDRRPCWISPYHYRLDWLVWFAAMSGEKQRSVGRDTWLLHLVWKLLHNDENILPLLAETPFPQKPPQAIKILVYQYEYSYDENWWKREYMHTWISPLTKESPQLLEFIEKQGWSKDL